MISTSSSDSYSVFATPRIVAFNAWQSPPLVKKATRFICTFLSNVYIRLCRALFLFPHKEPDQPSL